MEDIYNWLFDTTTITENGCWEYTRSKFPNGYGQVRYFDKGMGAHRLSYMICHGEIPSGKMVLHSCDNKPCINPSHLFLGTAKDNKHDSMNKDRHAYGSKIGISKLDVDSVSVVRQLLNEGLTKGQVAKRLGIGRTTVFNIEARNTWRHIT